MRKNDYAAPDKSIKDVKDLMAQYGCDDVYVKFRNDTVVVDITVGDSEE